MMQVLIERRDQEVLVDEGEDIVDDGLGSHLAFVLALVMQEAIQQHLLQSLVFEPTAFLELNLRFGQGLTHGIDLLMAGQERIFFASAPGC